MSKKEQNTELENKEALTLGGVNLQSEQLPSRKVQIDLDGNCLVEIEIKNNKLSILRAVDGWGRQIPLTSISVKEV